MDNREIIIQATIDLINEKGEQVEDITVREICKKANVGLGLVNYHFGNKDKLIELCVERIVNGIIEQFHSIRNKTETLTAFEKLEYLGNMTFTFLFEHYAVSKISILQICVCQRKMIIRTGHILRFFRLCPPAVLIGMKKYWNVRHFI